MSALIEIRTGSDSDIPKIRSAYEFLDAVGLGYQARVLSAHRTPTLSGERARALEGEGFRAVIAAAGGSAHLPGTTAAETLLPVIGLPMDTSSLEGLDSLYSIIQMPDGIPVASVGVQQGEAAAILAAQIAALGDPAAGARIRAHRKLSAAGVRVPDALIRVLRPRAVELPEDKITEALGLLTKLGVRSLSSTVAKWGETKAAAAAGSEGAGAILALCDAGSLTFPRLLSEKTHLPVIAVPFAEGRLPARSHRAKDDFLSRMLSVAPVAGIGVNRIKNGVLYAAHILAGIHAPVRDALRAFRARQTAEGLSKDAKLQSLGVPGYLKDMIK